MSQLQADEALLSARELLETIFNGLVLGTFAQRVSMGKGRAMSIFTGAPFVLGTPRPAALYRQVATVRIGAQSWMLAFGYARDARQRHPYQCDLLFIPGNFVLSPTRDIVQDVIQRAHRPHCSVVCAQTDGTLHLTKNPKFSPSILGALACWIDGFGVKQRTASKNVHSGHLSLTRRPSVLYQRAIVPQAIQALEDLLQTYRRVAQ